MKLASRLLLALKALRELGPDQLGLYALYKFGLQSGHYHRQLTLSLSRLNDLNRGPGLKLHPCLPGLPDRDAMRELLGDQISQLYGCADEIVGGKVRLFGGQPVPLILTPPKPLKDWIEYERGNNQIDGQDIKLIWEPGRFGWACTLAMAYHMSNDERYADAFWLNTEQFLTSNPPYRGPHWSSAQEVAIRIVALSLAIQVFIQSNLSTPKRLELIANTIAAHAERIPPTLVYARSQNNNHLISEALGLYTASALLSEHPLASKWHKLGWNWLQHAIQTQIDQDGTYTQHSTNYHRLMLQAALWAFALHDHLFINEPVPPVVSSRLEVSTHWLWKLVDPATGRVPNLGHNDGAYILPLTVCPYHDYRPVIYAAARTFVHSNLTPEGCWSDMSYWLGSPQDLPRTDVKLDFWREPSNPDSLTNQPPYILQNQKNSSWGTLRVARFQSRPAHADQLHLDLWWRGLNLAQDPGTYLYNAAPPWDNSLMSAFVHNTVTVDGKEFMLRASRFLYLEWAQAEVVGGSFKLGNINLSMMAQHNGYRGIGALHQRIVTMTENGHWRVTDHLDGSPGTVHTARLHWLLPDWEYELISRPEKTNLPGYEIRIHSPFGWVYLKAEASSAAKTIHQVKFHNFQLIRAGELLYGSGAVSPISGWTSPTYGDKIPALACILEISQSLPIELKSEWILPNET